MFILEIYQTYKSVNELIADPENFEILSNPDDTIISIKYLFEIYKCICTFMYKYMLYYISMKPEVSACLQE